MQITYRYRIKDKHVSRLSAQARAVNFVWNYCNETQTKAVKDGRKWLTRWDLQQLTAGASKEGLDLHSQTIELICKRYDESRRQHKKPWLNWRKSKGSRRSLRWVPFNQQAVQFCDSAFAFRGEVHRAMPMGAKIGCGSFSEDSRGSLPCLRGRWRAKRARGASLGVSESYTAAGPTHLPGKRGRLRHGEFR